jgi:hypothetical protein
MPATVQYADDPYQLCEDAIKSLLATVTELSQFDYQIATDDTVIGKGADYFVVVRPGAFPTEQVSMDEDNFTWHVNCTLYVRYKEYNVSWSLFKALRWKIIRLIRRDPNLSVRDDPDFANGCTGVWQTAITGPEDAQYFALEAKAVRPNFIIQEMQVRVTQRVGYDF